MQVFSKIGLRQCCWSDGSGERLWTER
jgi:hypothetical protein